MAARTNIERIDRLEQVMQVLAERQLGQEERQETLEHIVADLATEMRRGFDQVAVQFAETDRRMRETDERMKQTDERMKLTDERMKQTDGRIDKLVGAITQLIRSQQPLQT